MATKGSRSSRRVTAQIGDLDPRELIELGGGLWMQRRQPVTFFDEELGVDVTMAIEVDAGTGQLVVNEIRILRRPGAPPIGSKVLRGIRPAEYIVHRAAKGAWLDDGSGHLVQVGLGRLEGEKEEAYVARLYRMALAGGESPAKVVAYWLGVAESTAHQKVVLARKLGLLPPTTVGRPRSIPASEEEDV